MWRDGHWGWTIGSSIASARLASPPTSECKCGKLLATESSNSVANCNANISISDRPQKNYFSMQQQAHLCRVGKNPLFFFKPSPVVFFWVFFGFYWVLLGFIGFFGFYWVF
jgi:hypothetical protein